MANDRGDHEEYSDDYKVNTTLLMCCLTFNHTKELDGKEDGGGRCLTFNDTQRNNLNDE